MEEVVANIAATIGEDVFKQMEGVGWNDADPRPQAQPGQPGVPASTTEPAAPATSGQPASAATPAAPTADAPQLNWDSYKAENGKILGKYDNPNEAIKGVGHAVRMAKDALDEAAALRQKNAELEQRLRTSTPAPVTEAAPGQGTPGSTTQVASPVRSPKLDAVLSTLRENPVLDEETLEALISGLADQSAQVAREAVEQTKSADDAATRERERVWGEVDAHMAKNHPEAEAFGQEFGLFTQTNPLVREVVGTMLARGKHIEAAEFAWREFAQAHSVKPTTEAAQKEIEGEAADQVRREALEKARRNAGIIPTAAGGVHEVSTPAGPSREEIDQAASAMHAGYGEHWRALTIGRTLTGPFFDPQ